MWEVFWVFLRSPAISLGFTTFGWDFCVCDRFFNPTIMVVTFRLRGWCVLGVFFVAGIHPSRTWTSGSFESMWWNACVHRLDPVYTLIRRSFGGMEFETPREKSPLPESVPRGGSNPRHRGQRAHALPTELFRPQMWEVKTERNRKREREKTWKICAYMSVYMSVKGWRVNVRVCQCMHGHIKITEIFRGKMLAHKPVSNKFLCFLEKICCRQTESVLFQRSALQAKKWINWKFLWVQHTKLF